MTSKDNYVINTDILMAKLENIWLDDIVLVRTCDLYGLSTTYDMIVYRKSNDTYYLKLSIEKQCHINKIHSRRKRYVKYKKQLNKHTAYITQDNQLRIHCCVYDNLAMTCANNTLENYIDKLVRNNYTYPPIEEWKNNQWSGLK